MLRAFKFGLVVLMVAVLSMISAITTMHFAIHGAEVKVPSFKGLTVAEATDKAAAAGLNLTVDNHFYSIEVPAGRVVNQSPAPGTVVRREWRVALTESLGPQRVAIPDLTGMDQRLATIQIRRAGLEVGTVAEVPDAYAATGTVIGQSPAPGATGVESPVISLLTAAKPVDTSGGMVLPDFTGQPLSAALAAISRAGLKMSPVKTASPAVPTVGSPGGGQAIQAPLPSGTVLSQNPPPGNRVDATTTIELTVAD
jgi:eukaryotic-like serine/threonine-protein kinase